MLRIDTILQGSRETQSPERNKWSHFVNLPFDGRQSTMHLMPEAQHFLSAGPGIKWQWFAFPKAYNINNVHFSVGNIKMNILNEEETLLPWLNLQIGSF